MKKWVATRLRGLAEILDPSVPGDVLRLAKTLCDQFEGMGRGEYKHHLVYKQLVITFPRVPRRKLGLAIEKVMNDY